MHHLKHLLLTAFIVTIFPTTSLGQVVFQQDFSSSTNVADYFDSSPNSGQFDDINSGANNVVSISSDTLLFMKTGGNSAGFVRTADLASSPSVLVFTINVGVSGNSTAETSSTEVAFQVGSGFGTVVGAENPTNVHSRIGFNWTSTDGQWAIERGGSTASPSSNYTGTQTITWVINNSGAPINYNDPSGGTSSLANDTFDAWIGNSLELSSVTATSAGVSLTDFKFAFSSSAENAGVYFDSISVSAVPEPSSFAALLGLGALGLVATRRRRRKTHSVGAA